MEIQLRSAAGIDYSALSRTAFFIYPTCIHNNSSKIHTALTTTAQNKLFREHLAAGL